MESQRPITTFFSVTRHGRSPLSKRKKLAVEVEARSTSSVIVDEQKVQTRNLTIRTPVDVAIGEESGASLARKRPQQKALEIPRSASRNPGKAKRQLQFTQLKQQEQQEKPKEEEVEKQCEKEDVKKEEEAQKPLVVPGDLKKRLGKVRNLQELRQGLGKFSEKMARMNEQLQMNDAEERERLLIHLSPKKVTISPLKSPLKTPVKLPAYEGLAYLKERTEAKLELPTSHKVLDEMFRGTETVVSLLSNRDELVTFDKLQKAVQEMVKRNFEKNNLGQIKTVYPEAYNYEVRKVHPQFGQRNRTEKHDLIIAPNLQTDLINYKLSTPVKTPTKPDCSPSKLALPRTPIKSPSKLLDVSKLTGSRQIYRREIFRKNLFNIVKSHHLSFLASLTPPVRLSAEEENGLRRWHPQFKLDQIPPVSPSPLPEVQGEVKTVTAKELLAATPGSFPSRLAKALQTASSASSSSASSPTLAMPANSKALKGISASLVEKIRAKQSAKEQLLLLRRPEEETRQARLVRLPDFIRVLRNYSLTENKSAFPLNMVIAKLNDSCGSLNEAELQKHLDLLVELLPKWISRSDIPGKGSYVKMERGVPLADLEAELNKP